MPRRARIIIPGVPHHFTQRGNNRLRVFDSDHERRQFLGLLAKHAEKFQLEIWGYCLMPNHYHLIAVPRAPESASLALGVLNGDYARLVNIHREACGHLWQSRFYSVAMDPAYTWRALAYVERNPVRANIVADAAQYPWSSLKARLGLSAAPPWLALSEWRKQWEHREWLDFVNETASDADFASTFRTNTATGRPLGASLATPAPRPPQKNGACRECPHFSHRRRNTT